MKIVKLKKEKFDEIAKNHSLGNYYQTVAYGNLMTTCGFTPNYLGFVHNKLLVGIALILSKEIFMGFKYGYAPHGLLINYDDTNIVPELLKKLKSYLFKSGYLILKIDPLIIKSIRDKKGNIINENPNLNSIMKTLSNGDFLHCGFNNYLESVKPRWHAVLGIKDQTSPELFYKLDKNVRNKLRKATKFGIEIYKASNDEIDTMYNFIKDKGNYSLKYYKDFAQCFPEDFEIYFARINTSTYVANSKNLYEKEAENNDILNNTIQDEGLKGKNMRSILNKKMESDRVLSSYKKHLIFSTNLLKENPDSVIIGGAIVIKHNNTLNFLIDGYLPEYQNLSPAYLTKWKIIEKYANSNIEYFDLNAIVGNFNKDSKYKGLNDSRLGFNAKAIEYIGEFNVISNKPMYNLYRNTASKFSLKNQKK